MNKIALYAAFLAVTGLVFVATATQIVVDDDVHTVSINGVVDPNVTGWDVKDVSVNAKSKTLIDFSELGMLTTGTITVLCKLEPDGVGTTFAKEKRLYMNPQVWEMKEFSCFLSDVPKGSYSLYIYAFEDGDLKASYSKSGVMID